MELLFELNLGYVSCDICGEGYNYVAVWYDVWAPADTPYRVVRNSRCYGNVDTIQQSQQQVVEFLESNVFMIATRRARPVYNRFLRDIKRGMVKPSDKALAAYSEPATVEAYSEPEAVPGYVEEYEDNGAMIGCNCDSCEASRGNLPVRSVNQNTNSGNSINWLTNISTTLNGGLAV